MHKNKTSGFTLVESAIVILIVGFLIVGVVQGYEMVKTARLVSDIKKIQEYKLAVQTFVDKYEKLPGDFSKATVFFSNPSILNGNGDGVVRSWHGYAPPIEYLWTWTHLSYAGVLKSGAKGGRFDSSGLDYLEVGVNVPRLSKEYMGINFVGAEPGVILTSWHWNNPSGKNFFQLGSTSTVGYGDYFWGAGYTAFESAYIDEKIDDGKAATGLVLGRETDKGRANQYGYPGFPCTNASNEYKKDDEKTGCHVRYQID